MRHVHVLSFARNRRTSTPNDVEDDIELEKSWTLRYSDRPFPGCLRGSVKNPRLKGGVLKRK